MKVKNLNLCWIMVIAATLSVTFAHGQISGSQPQIGITGKFKAAPTETFGDSRDAVSATGEIPSGTARPGALVPVAIRVKVKSGWHMWPVESQARSVADAEVFEGAIFPR